MLKTFTMTTALALAMTSGLASPLVAQERTEFTIAWTIYVGWMPWGYLEESGIMDEWAERYDIDVEIVQINDYIEAINQYSAGAFDAVGATNMDALSIPAGGGVDTTSLIVGDYSAGNDAIIIKGEGDLTSLEGQTVNLVELSVSHYLLVRALESVGLSERDLAGIVNTSDADMIAAFSTSDVTAVATWNPMVEEILQDPTANSIYNSSDIPGEIVDIMWANTEVLDANPAFGMAVAGAWFEVMELMAAGDEEVLTAMAEASGTDLAGFQRQLDATEMFYTPQEAVAFTESAELQTTMTEVAEFLFENGILGEGAPSPDFVGIEYPDGTVIGNPDNVQLRYDTTYMQMAADGEL